MRIAGVEEKNCVYCTNPLNEPDSEFNDHTEKIEGSVDNILQRAYIE